MPVFLTPLISSVLSNLVPSKALGSQLLSANFLVDGVSKPYDSSDHCSSQKDLGRLYSYFGDPPYQWPQILRLLPTQQSQILLQSQAHAAQLTGTSPTVRSMPVQIIKVAQSLSWNSCGHILPIGTFLDSLLLGKIAR